MRKAGILPLAGRAASEGGVRAETAFSTDQREASEAPELTLAPPCSPGGNPVTLLNQGLLLTGRSWSKASGSPLRVSA